jgi:NRPS condensation-like uncharacterized protein/non-homologous end joining protein Ku
MSVSKIDEVLLAHIFNGSSLQGTFGLQGTVFKITNQFLNQYIATEQGTPEPVKVLLHNACSQLIYFEDMFIRLNNINTVSIQDAQALAKQMHEAIKNLEGDKYLLLPGGWSTHAIIYQFSLNQTEDLLFSVYNSGSGLEFHEAKSHTEKNLYNPVFTYLIPKKNIHSPHFSEILTQLIAARIPALQGIFQANVNAKYLYQHIFPQFSHLDAELTLLPIQLDCDTAGQLSGTCAQSVLHQMLKSKFPDLDAYRRFIYRFKRYALQQYMANIENPISAHKQSQVRKAIRHQLRLLNVLSRSNPEKDLFPEEYKQQEMINLQRYLSYLPPSKPTEAPTPPQKNMPVQSQLFQYEHIINVRASCKKESPTDLHEPERIFGGENFHSSLEKILTRSRYLDNNQLDQALFEQLENCFLSLPLPGTLNSALHPFYSSIDSEQSALLFYQKINALQVLYSKCITRLIGYSSMGLPRIMLSKMSVFAVVAHINHHIKLTPLGFCFHKFCGYLLHVITPGSNDTPYLASDDYEKTQRLMHIQRLYPQNQGDLHGDVHKMASGEICNDLHLEVLGYYQSLLQSDPASFSLLQERYWATYSTENSPLHGELRKHQLTALFYFIEHRRELKVEASKNEPQWQALLNRFDIQAELEKSYALFSTLNVDKAIQVGFINNGFLPEQKKIYLKPISPVFNRDCRPIELSDGLKFTLPKSAQAFALQVDMPTNKFMSTHPKVTDNKVQLVPAEFVRKYKPSESVPINTAVLEERELFHLRRCNATQIALTLDYFQKHLEKLSRHEMQVYLEANLFQPGLLCLQLTPLKQESFWLQFDAFIEQGLNQYNGNKLLNAASLFFIRLSYLVTQYAAQQNLDFLTRLERLFRQLNHWLSGMADEDFRAGLHQYRFLTAVRLLQLKSTAHLNDALISYFYMRAIQNNQEKADTDTQFTIQCINHDWMRQLHNRHTAFDFPILLPKILHELGIAIPEDAHVSGQYPVFEIGSHTEKLTLNIEHGRIYQGDLAYSVAPLALRLHPLLRHIGIKDVHFGFISADETLFQTSKGAELLRFIKDVGFYHVQKSWLSTQGNREWYQLMPFSDDQRTWLMLAKGSNFEMPGYPLIISERGNLAWSSIETMDVLLTQRNQPLFQGPKQGPLQTIDGQARLVGSITTWIHQLCSAFEDRKFIIVTEAIDASEYMVNLARYRLQFTVSKKNNQLYYLFEGKQYHFQENHLPLGQGIASLHFKAGDRELCLLPIQRFLNTNEREVDGEYYRLQQDLSGIVADTLVKKSLDQNKSILWQYSGTEQFFAVLMSNGKLSLQTPAEALYLCYLYLGSNQPEKAWKVLSHCESFLGGLSGQYEEIKFLNWICHDLPTQIEHNDSQARISTPPFESCKLKALALLAGLWERDQTVDFPLLPIGEQPEVLYKRDEILSVKSFFYSANSTIYSLYVRLQAMRRDLPIFDEEELGFELSDKEKQQLLDYYYAHLPTSIPGNPKAVGALGYEWVALHLKTLRREYNTLVDTAEIRALNLYEQRRKEEILSTIQSHEGIAKIRSELVYCNIDLTFDSKLNYATLSAAAVTAFMKEKPLAVKTTSADISTALSLLSPSLSDSDCILQFPHFLHIAINGKPEEKKQLNHFCQATLIAHRHVLPSKQRDMTKLCNALYRIMCSGKLELPDTASNNELLHHVSKFTPNPIGVPELVNRIKGTLVTAQELWESIPASTPKRIPLSTSAKEYVASLGLFSETQQPDVLVIKSTWQNAYMIYQTGGNHLINPQMAGNARLDGLAALKRLSNTHLANPKNQENLKQVTQNRLEALQKNQKSLTLKILKAANQALEASQRWQIDALAMKSRRVNMPELLTLYFHDNLERYAYTTRLSSPEIEQLHEQLIVFVADELRCQQLRRVLKQLAQAQTASAEESEQQYFYLGEALFADNMVNTAREPALSLFQYYEDLLLRPQQKEVIEHLLETPEQDTFTESVVKMIMGAGKSKVFLPILAQKKATGSNLVIIEVPRALLRTNFVDLKATSMKLFKQSVHLFEFNRYSDCSPERLEQQFNLLTNIMINRDYLVTTGDAIQSLELKYLELLDTSSSASPDTLERWKKQIYWADQLVLLLRHRGDLIIDEVHQGLLLKNKLNYTLDTESNVPQNILKYTVELYQFFQEVFLDDLELTNHTLYDLILNNQLLTQINISQQSQKLSQAHLYQQLMDVLAHKLVTHDQSPLSALIKKHSHISEFSQSVLQYLHNKSAIPPYIIDLKEKELLALYKEQINQLLPMSMSRNFCEHYGPSKLNSLSPEVRALAIPYLANNVPNEHSRFSSWLETINFTIQSFIIGGLSRELVKQFINDLLTKACIESRDFQHFEQTPSATLFTFLQTNQAKQWRLSEVEIDNEQQLEEITQQLRHNRFCIFEVLKRNVLKQIRKDNRILHSDAYNHVDIVRSCQGMSGTPSNHSTFHQRLHFDEKVALGTDEYIIAGIHVKQPSIYAIDFKNNAAFINDVFSPYEAEDKVRAIIDISASFKGIDNLDVAKEIANYIARYPDKFSQPKAIQYVLFFNEANQLAAIPVRLNTLDCSPIVIGTSDPNIIQDRLDCSPQERFTFYDQAHTLGADIKQFGRSKGIAMIGSDTHLSHFLQGAMRERELISGQQTLDIIVPKLMDGNTLPDLLQIMTRNEQQQILKDNFQAARLCMMNLVRASFIQVILAIRGDDAAVIKQQLFSLFKHHFIEEETSDFFNLYGGLDYKVATSEQLTFLKTKLFEDWKDLISQAEFLLIGQATISEEAKQLEEKLHNVVERACRPGVCLPEQWQRLQENAEVKTKVQVQVQNKVFTEKEVLNEIYNPNLCENSHQAWTSLIPPESAKLVFKTLNEICNTTKSRYTPNFNPNICASNNFYLTYQNQECLIDLYAKPVHALLFKKEGKQFYCTLLTPTECNELKDMVTGPKQTKQYWITTTQHTLLAGTPPLAVHNDTVYQEIIEQVRYFNGDFQLLLDSDLPLTWLKQDTENKLKFFEDYLQHYREVTTENIKRLRSVLSRKINIYQEIISNPTKDLRNENWTNHFSEITEEDIGELNQLANVFYRATTTWWQTDLNTIAWQKVHRLPLMVMGYLAAHVAKMNFFRMIITHIAKGKSLEEMAPQVLLEHNIDSVARYLNSVGDDDRDYNFYVDLLNEIPPIPEPRHVLLANIAKHQCLNAKDLKRLVDYIQAKTTPKREKNEIIWQLLNNPSQQITPEVFKLLMYNSCDKQALCALAKHVHLRPPEFILLLKKAAPYEQIFRAELLTLLLHHQAISNMSLEAVVTLIAHEGKLLPADIDTLLETFEAKATLSTLIGTLPDIESFKIIVNHPVFEPANSERLLRVLNQCSDETIRLHCLQHSAADDAVNHCFLNGEFTQEQLVLIAKKANDPRTLQCVVNKTSADFKQHILTLIIERHLDVRDMALIIDFEMVDPKQLLDTYPQLLKPLIDKKSDAQSFESIVRHTAFKQADTADLQAIISKCNIEDVRLQCLQHPAADDAVYQHQIGCKPTRKHLEYIAEHSQNPETLQRLMTKPAPALKAQLLLKLIERNLDLMVLQPLLALQPPEAIHLEPLLTNYPPLLPVLLNKAVNLNSLTIVINHPVFKQANSERLLRVLNQCSDETIRLHCLQHSAADDAVYHCFLNGEFTQEQLVLIAKKANDPIILQCVVNKTSADFKQHILTLIIERHLDVRDMALIIDFEMVDPKQLLDTYPQLLKPLIDKKSDAQSFESIVRHTAFKQADTADLQAIISKCNIEDVRLQCLQHPAADDAVYQHQIGCKPTRKHLEYIAEHSQNPETLQRLMTKPAPALKAQLLLKLIERNLDLMVLQPLLALQPPEAIHLEPLLTNYPPLLPVLLNKAVNLNSLTIVINHPVFKQANSERLLRVLNQCSDETIRLHCLQHSAADDAVYHCFLNGEFTQEQLVLIAKKANDPIILQCVVNKTSADFKQHILTLIIERHLDVRDMALIIDFEMVDPKQLLDTYPQLLKPLIDKKSDAQSFESIVRHAAFEQADTADLQAIISKCNIEDVRLQCLQHSAADDAVYHCLLNGESTQEQLVLIAKKANDPIILQCVVNKTSADFKQHILTLIIERHLDVRDMALIIDFEMVDPKQLLDTYPQLLKPLIDKKSDAQSFESIVRHTAFKQADTADLQAIISKCNIEDVRLQCLQHPAADDAVYQHQIGCKPTRKHLEYIAEHSQNPETLQRLMTKPAPALKAQLLLKLIERNLDLMVLQPLLALQPPEAIHLEPLLTNYPPLLPVLLNKAVNLNSLTIVINHPVFKQANSERLLRVLNQCSDETIRLHCLQHSAADDAVYHCFLNGEFTQEQLVLIAKKANDPIILQCVVNKTSADFKQHILTLIIERHLDVRDMALIIDFEMVDPKQLLDTYPQLLKPLIDKKSDAQSFESIVRHTAFKQADTADLQAIISKCNIEDVRLQCLQHPAADDAVYQHQIGCKPTRKHLEYIAEHSQNPETLQRLMTKPAPALKAQLLLKLIERNLDLMVLQPLLALQPPEAIHLEPLLTNYPPLLPVLLNKAVNLNSLTIVINHPVFKQANSERLLRVLNQCSDETIRLHCLQHSAADDAVYHCFLNGEFTQEQLVLIAKKANDPIILQCVVNKTSADFKQHILTLIIERHLDVRDMALIIDFEMVDPKQLLDTYPQLLKPLIDKKSDAQSFESIVRHAAFEQADTADLQAIISKCNIEDVRLQCLQHSAADDAVYHCLLNGESTQEQLVLIAKKANDPRILQCVVNKTSADFKQHILTLIIERHLDVRDMALIIDFEMVDPKQLLDTYPQLLKPLIDKKSDAQSFESIVKHAAFEQADTADLQAIISKCNIEDVRLQCLQHPAADDAVYQHQIGCKPTRKHLEYIAEHSQNPETLQRLMTKPAPALKAQLLLKLIERNLDLMVLQPLLALQPPEAIHLEPLLTNYPPLLPVLLNKAVNLNSLTIVINHPVFKQANSERLLRVLNQCSDETIRLHCLQHSAADDAVYHCFLNGEFTQEQLVLIAKKANDPIILQCVVNKTSADFKQHILTLIIERHLDVRDMALIIDFEMVDPKQLLDTYPQLLKPLIDKKSDAQSFESIVKHAAFEQADTADLQAIISKCNIEDVRLQCLQHSAADDAVYHCLLNGESTQEQLVLIAKKANDPIILQCVVNKTSADFKQHILTLIIERHLDVRDMALIIDFEMVDPKQLLDTYPQLLKPLIDKKSDAQSFESIVRHTAFKQADTADLQAIISKCNIEDVRLQCLQHPAADDAVYQHQIGCKPTRKHLEYIAEHSQNPETLQRLMTKPAPALKAQLLLKLIERNLDLMVLQPLLALQPPEAIHLEPLLTNYPPLLPVLLNKAVNLNSLTIVINHPVFKQANSERLLRVLNQCSDETIRLHCLQHSAADDAVYHCFLNGEFTQEQLVLIAKKANDPIILQCVVNKTSADFKQHILTLIIERHLDVRDMALIIDFEMVDPKQLLDTYPQLLKPLIDKKSDAQSFESIVKHAAFEQADTADLQAIISKCNIEDVRLQCLQHSAADDAVYHCLLNGESTQEQLVLIAKKANDPIILQCVVNKTSADFKQHILTLIIERHLDVRDMALIIDFEMVDPKQLLDTYPQLLKPLIDKKSDAQSFESIVRHTAFKQADTADLQAIISKCNIEDVRLQCLQHPAADDAVYQHQIGCKPTRKHLEYIAEHSQNPETLQRLMTKPAPALKAQLLLKLIERNLDLMVLQPLLALQPPEAIHLEPLLTNYPPLLPVLLNKAVNLNSLTIVINHPVFKQANSERLLRVLNQCSDETIRLHCLQHSAADDAVYHCFLNGEFTQEQLVLIAKKANDPIILQCVVNKTSADFKQHILTLIIERHLDVRDMALIIDFEMVDPKQLLDTYPQLLKPLIDKKSDAQSFESIVRHTAFKQADTADLQAIISKCNIEDVRLQCLQHPAADDAVYQHQIGCKPTRKHLEYIAEHSQNPETLQRLMTKPAPALKAQLLLKLIERNLDLMVLQPLLALQPPEAIHLEPLLTNYPPLLPVLLNKAVNLNSLTIVINHPVFKQANSERLLRVLNQCSDETIRLHCLQHSAADDAVYHCFLNGEFTQEQLVLIAKKANDPIILQCVVNKTSADFKQHILTLIIERHLDVRDMALIIDFEMVDPKQLLDTYPQLLKPLIDKKSDAQSFESIVRHAAFEQADTADLQAIISKCNIEDVRLQCLQHPAADDAVYQHQIGCKPTRKHLEYIAEHSQNPETLQRLMTKPAPALKAQLLLKLIERNLDLMVLQPLLALQPLEAIHLEPLLTNYPPLLPVLLNKAVNLNSLTIVINHPVFKQANSERLLRVLNQCSDETIRLHCLQHSAADDAVYHCFLNGEFTQEQLVLIAKKANDPIILQCVVNKTSADFKQHILTLIIERHLDVRDMALIIDFEMVDPKQLLDTYPQLLKPLIDKKSDAQSFESIVRHAAFEQADTADLQAIISKCNIEDVRLQCLQHPAADDAVYQHQIGCKPTRKHLEYIAEHSQNPETLQRLMTKPAPALKAQLLLKLIERNLDLMVLQPLLALQPLEAIHLEPLLTNYPPLLPVLLNKAVNLNSLTIVINHPVFKQANSERLLRVLNQCSDETIRLHCLQHSAADDAVYHCFLNGEFTQEQLVLIAKKANDPIILQCVVNKTSADFKQHILTLIIERHLDVRDMALIIDFEMVDPKQLLDTYPQLLKPLIDKKSDAQSFESIVKHAAFEQADTADLQAIISKCNIEDVRLQCLQHQHVGEKVLQALLESPALTTDVLATVISKAKNFEILLKIAKHPLATSKMLEKHPFGVKITLTKLLKELQIKTNLLINKGTPGAPLFNPKYQDVAKSAQTLNTKLNQTFQVFMNTEEPITPESLAKFKENVQHIIREAKTEFSHHRGAWYTLKPILRQCLGILAGMTLWPMLGVMIFTKNGYRKTFFETPASDAFDKLKSFEEQVKKQNTIRQI